MFLDIDPIHVIPSFTLTDNGDEDGGFHMLIISDMSGWNQLRWQCKERDWSIIDVGGRW